MTRAKCAAVWLWVHAAGIALLWTHRLIHISAPDGNGGTFHLYSLGSRKESRIANIKRVIRKLEEKD